MDKGILSYLTVAWRRRRMIVILVVAALVAAAVVSFVLPKMYQSSATIIAPKEVSSSALLGGLAASTLLQQVPGVSLPSFTSSRDLLMSLLKSRTIAQAVIEHFKLQERDRLEFQEDAIRRLQELVAISVSREGVITIRVEDRDSALAAQIANFYVEQLDRMVARYHTGEAGHQRTFLTEQLTGTKARLDESERALRSFQESNRAIVLQEQTRGAIEAAARLKGEIMASEVQLQVIRSFATDANPDVVTLRRRIDEMNRQLARMQYGDGSTRRAADGAGRRDFVVPFSQVPGVGLELARLTREVKVQETMMTLLTQQVEQARIAEAKDLPVVQLLDRAVPAQRASKPRLIVNLAVAGVASLFAAVLLAFVLEYAKNVRRSQVA